MMKAILRQKCSIRRLLAARHRYRSCLLQQTVSITFHMHCWTTDTSDYVQLDSN